jgi:hypothetical protein
MNPFISFCLYVAARVFVQYLKSRPKDAQVRASLQFLLSAMHAIKRKNPLTESFLVQLDVDLESAGLEGSRNLRAQVNKTPTAPIRPGMGGCGLPQTGLQPVEGDTMNMQTDQRTPPVYGDQGLGVYNDPSKNPHIVPVVQNAGVFGYKHDDYQNFTNTNNSSPFELPNRQRTPGSLQGSHRSPQSANNNVEMDTSPDNSNDQQTPGSSTHSQPNQSSHTSNTGYSPQGTQGGQPHSLFSGVFDANNNASFATDFDMHSFPHSAAENQPTGFVVSQNWNSGSTGFTPGPSTGMTPGSSMNELLGMSDADWNQMMDSFSGAEWNAGMSHDATMQESMHRRL